jgi:AcrR family transcriptional regulator
MTRLAADRDTHLTPAETAAEALRQLDERATEPSIRSIALELRVTPAAIYHHFPSRAAIFQAAVELVWDEATREMLRLVPAPLETDPADVLLAIGIATRRAWLTHHRAARYMAATPEASAFITNTLELMTGLFERLCDTPEEAALSFHSYASFMIGAVLFAADRKTADEQLAQNPGPRDRTSAGQASETPRLSGNRTRQLINEMMDLSVENPARDEDLYAHGLRRLIASFTRG